MSTKQRRERDKEKMRRRILDAAKLLFVKEGFDNVSLRRIAATIDYSPAAIYRYFKNKREILSVLRDEGFMRYLVRQKTVAQQYPDPFERLLAGGKGYIQFAMHEPEYFQLMFCTNCDQVALEGQWAENSIQCFSYLQRNVEACVATGRFGEIDLEPAVFAMWAGVHGLAHLVNTGQVAALSQNLDLDPMLDQILRFWLRPIASESNE